MTNIEELIETAERLARNLDLYAEEEKRLSIDLELVLENMSYDSYCMSNSLKEIKYYVGV